MDGPGGPDGVSMVAPRAGCRLQVHVHVSGARAPKDSGLLAACCSWFRVIKICPNIPPLNPSAWSTPKRLKTIVLRFLMGMAVAELLEELVR